MDKVRDLILTDPMDLLSDDRHLLEEDFEYLGKAPSSHREYLVAEMDTALELARRRRGPISLTSHGIVQLSHHGQQSSNDFALHQPHLLVLFL